MSDDTAPGGTRKRLTAAERRRLLVAAALRVMRRDGFAAATTRAICAEAEMPHGAFHYCFHSKKDLYRALMATEVEIDFSGLWTVVSPAASPGDNIRALLLAYWARIEAEPDAQLVLYELDGHALRDPDLHDLAEWGEGAGIDNAAEAIARLAVEGGFSLRRDARAVAELVVSVLDGVTRAWLHHGDDARARSTLSDVADLLATLTATAEDRDDDGPVPPTADDSTWS